MPDLICDFCAAADPTWEYMAGEVLLPDGTLSIGSWCACDTCRELIDLDDREALAHRAHNVHSELPVELYREIQDRFFAVRTGPAKAIQLTPIHGRIFDR